MGAERPGWPDSGLFRMDFVQLFPPALTHAAGAASVIVGATLQIRLHIWLLLPRWSTSIFIGKPPAYQCVLRCSRQMTHPRDAKTIAIEGNSIDRQEMAAPASADQGFLGNAQRELDQLGAISRT